ncbi:MAG: hypothetical protein AB1938_19135 [Myxococcota bacterium]
MVRILSALVVLWAAAAFAQATATAPDLRDAMSARNHGMGGAFESLGYGAEVILGNPAALSLYKRYQIEGNGGWDPGLGYGYGSIAVADSTNALAAGISYQFCTFGGEERRWAHTTSLALAYPLAEFLHLGATVRYNVLVGASNTNSVTMNAGLVVRPASFLSIGFSGHNLIPNYNVDLPRYFVVSVSGMFLDQLSPVFDLWMDFNQPTARFDFRGGVEWLVAQSFPLRLGYQYDGITGRQYFGGGIGYFVEGSGIDLAYRHELADGTGKLIALTLKLQL